MKRWNRVRVVGVAAVSFLSLLFATPSAMGAGEGCPDSWNMNWSTIDPSSGQTVPPQAFVIDLSGEGFVPIVELSGNLKAALAASSLDVVVTYSQLATVDGVVAKDRIGAFSGGAYLASQKRISYSVVPKVEKRGCQPVTVPPISLPQPRSAGSFTMLSGSTQEVMDAVFGRQFNFKTVEGLVAKANESLSEIKMGVDAVNSGNGIHISFYTDPNQYFDQAILDLLPAPSCASAWANWDWDSRNSRRLLIRVPRPCDLEAVFTAYNWNSAQKAWNFRSAVLARYSVTAAQVSTKPRGTTIVCAKGKQVKRVTAVKPRCPSGWKIRK